MTRSDTLLRLKPSFSTQQVPQASAAEPHQTQARLACCLVGQASVCRPQRKEKSVLLEKVCAHESAAFQQKSSEDCKTLFAACYSHERGRLWVCESNTKASGKSLSLQVRFARETLLSFASCMQPSVPHSLGHAKIPTADARGITKSRIELI